MHAGGFAASEWLQKNLLQYIENDWEPSNVSESLSEAFRLVRYSADITLLVAQWSLQYPQGVGVDVGVGVGLWQPSRCKFRRRPSVGC